MKLTNIKYIFLLIFIMSCKNSNEKNNDQIDLLINNPNKVDSLANDAKVNLREKIELKHLNGIWAENENENAIFEIVNDSLRYIENYEVLYKIRIDHEILKIYMDSNYVSNSQIVKVNNDSLILKSEKSNKTLKLYKR